MAFARFMASPIGRGIRIVAGVALLAWGFTAGNWILDVIGVVALASGVLNVCAIGAMLGGPFRGSDIPPAAG